MRAVVYDRYRGPLVLRDVPLRAPRRGEVEVRVRAAALNPKDVLVHLGKLSFWSGRRFPKTLGYDWSGEAVATGPGVAAVRPGDELFGMIQAIAGGACAERAIVRVDECATKPAALTFEEAAALSLAGQTALQALKDLARVRPGNRVLVNGASGGVGSMAIPIAKALGAHVTTTSSAKNLAFCRARGADEAMDYAAPSFGTYDVVFDVFGNLPFGRAKAWLTPKGVWISTVIRAHVFAAHARTLFARQRARLVVVRSRRADLEWLAENLRPVIDHVYDADAIEEARAHVASKHARGKVVVRFP